jgi:hypothetical protein
MSKIMRQIEAEARAAREMHALLGRAPRAYAVDPEYGQEAYEAWRQAMGKGDAVHVTLNGQTITGVVFADEAAGCAITQHIQACNGYRVRTHHCGKVRVTLSSELKSGSANNVEARTEGA